MPDEPVVNPEPTSAEPQTEPKAEPKTEPKAETQSEPILSPETSPPALVNGDGTFAENWRQNLPEEYRDEECWDTVTDFPNMAKQFVNQRKAIGKNRVAVPNEKSTPEEWNAFYDATGRPKTADDYKVDVPEDLQELFAKERLDAARQLAYKIGASEKQFAEYMQGEMEQAVKLLEAKEEAEKQAVQAAKDALRKEFGAAYDERVHVANRIVAEAFPNKEQQMEFLEQFGNEPLFVRFASIVGARLVESKGLIAELTQDTPGEAAAKIAKLQATPGYTDRDETRMTTDERTAITNQIRELYKQTQARTKEG